ncbi:MAG: hypothetical protein ACRDS1_02030 [Pseudonocardiaceae bacterium]
MAAGTAAAMVLLPGAASAQSVHSMQQFAGTTGDPAVPGVPGDAPSGPAAPNAPAAPQLPVPGVPELGLPGAPGGIGAPSLTGADDDDDVIHRDDTEDSDHLEDPRPPDHASGSVLDLDLGGDDDNGIDEESILEITKYDATIEDDGETHADSTVLGLGGERIVGSDASSKGENRDGDDGDLLDLCDATGGVICLSLLYHDTIATEDRDASLAAARGGVLALCLLGDDDDVTATYECDGLLSLGVAEGLGVAERDNKHGHTKAESANELLNLCIGQREEENLTEGCDGLGLQAVHSESESESKEPSTDRNSYLIGIDTDGESSYLLDEPEAITLLEDDCGDSAILCLFLNQGKSVIFKNPKGAGSVQEALRLDVLNRTLLLVLGQAETLAHETKDRDRGKPPECDDKIDNDGDGHIDFPKDKGCDAPHDDSEAGEKGEEHGDGGGDGGLADTGADVMPLLAGGFLLTGMGALTVAATRRRAGKHTL